MSGNAKIRASAQAGIAAKDKYTALSLAGVRRDPRLAIFPIIRQHADKKTLELVGTGFYVAKGGIFLTARHVLETAQDDDERGPFAPGVIHFMPDGTYYERGVRMTVCSLTADIGIGVVQEAKHNQTGAISDNPILRLTPRDPIVGEGMAVSP